VDTKEIARSCEEVRARHRMQELKLSLLELHPTVVRLSLVRAGQACMAWETYDLVIAGANDRGTRIHATAD